MEKLIKEYHKRRRDRMVTETTWRNHYEMEMQIQGILQHKLLTVLMRKLSGRCCGLALRRGGNDKFLVRIRMRSPNKLTGIQIREMKNVVKSKFGSNYDMTVVGPLQKVLYPVKTRKRK